MTMPNFFLVGAAKSGTSALYHYLTQHPDVFMSRWKEPKYFAFDGPEQLVFRGPDGPAPVNETAVTDRAVYEDLFADATHERIRGEASAIYLYSERAPERIAAEVPDARLVAILRNPVDRAISSYKHLVRDGREPLSLREGLDAEPDRIESNYGFLWRYVDLGWYSQQLDTWQRHFDPAQLLVVVHDDLRADPQAVCAQIQEFLGVDPTFRPDTSLRPNRSGQPRSRVLHRVLNPPAPVARRLWDAMPQALRAPLRSLQLRMTGRNLAPITIADEDRARLVEIFRDEIGRLEQRFGRDLSHWLQ